MEDRFELADKIAKKRATIAIVLGVLLLVQQGVFVVNWQHVEMLAVDMRRVDLLQVAGWMLWVIMLLVLLATGGGWFQPAEVRALLNDESTKAHRNAAMALGFWLMAGMCILLYLVAMLEPVNERLAIHLILTIGVAATLFRFGKLERAALADG